MHRPALVLLTVLVGAGWGAPAVAQDAPANARAAFVGGVGAEPDTTSPWRYYPLAVGNVWEYEFRGGLVQRFQVVGDTAALGRRYFVQEAWATSGQEPPERAGTVALRYDTTTATVRALGNVSNEYSLTPHCPLDAPFGEVVCDGQPDLVTGQPDGLLVFGGDRPGTGTDTVRAAVKTFLTRSGFESRYAVDIGLVFEGGEGSFQALTYYKVGGEEHGVSQFSVSSAPASPASGAALAVAPNPVAGAATVRLDLPAPADVRVAVYDVLGRRVATLAAGALGAGAHRLPLDASRLAPGAYVVRAEVGGGGALVRRVTVAR